MYTFVTFKCMQCDSVIFNLPKNEARKLIGFSFLCDCCDQPLEIKTLKPDDIVKEALINV